MGYLNLQFTGHADTRVQQRGVKKSVMEFILNEADMDLPAGQRFVVQSLFRRETK